MQRNIVSVYETKDELLSALDKAIRPDSARHLDFSFFDKSEMGSPVVVDDGLARKWLEVNYLFSTGFRPNMRPGVGEIGADIRSVREIENGSDKYLSVNLGLLDRVITALNDYRSVEDICAEWLGSREKYAEEASRLQKSVASLSAAYPHLNEFSELFENSSAYRGWHDTGMPSENFVAGLVKLRDSLKDLPDQNAVEAAQVADQLNRGLSKYSSAVGELSKIRKYHKGVPWISDDGVVRIYTPAASGGLSVHTHPAYDDPICCMPSESDLTIIAAQSGSLGANVIQVGGGETKGEHYIMHIPKKHFFKEVQQIVDRENLSDDKDIIQAKEGVLKKYLDDIMDGEILGFKIDGNNGRRVAVLSPVVAEREYDRHKAYLQACRMEGEPLVIKDMLLDAGSGYALWTPQVKEILAQNIGKFMKKE